MKYIRTKSGQLFTVVEKIDKTKFNHSFKYLYRIKEIEKIDNGSNIVVDVNVIKEADTIEELIDEYVAIKDNGKPFVIKKYEIYSNLQLGFTIYGSIWVNSNLITVAKMNEIGDLCLI